MPKDPTGTVVRNLLLLRGIENSLADEVNAIIEALYDDIAAQIARIDPTGVSETYRAARLQKLMAEIEALSKDAFDEIEKLVRQRAAEVGSTQADFAERVLRTALTGVSVTVEPNRIGINLLKAILDEDPIQGHLLRDWFRGQRDGTVFKVRREIQLGMVQNETIDDMVRRVRGRRVGFRRRDPTTGLFVPKGTKGAALEPVFQGGVMQTTTREATAIVRTAVNHIANVAHQKTYEENTDIVTHLEFVAVLDSRTCFAAGTAVETPTGPRPIETFETGDEVIGGSGETRQVLGTRKSRGQIARVKLSNGEIVYCTPDHMFLAASGEWREIESLEPGTELSEAHASVPSL